VVSTEYRADSVFELRDHTGAVRTAVIVEVQLGTDRDKRYTWPLYATALRARLRCPVVLLVITSEPAVARWARQPIAIGHPGFSMQPIALSFGDLPRIVDPAHARRLPELSVLSAMAHPEVEVAAAAIGAIAGLPEDQNRLYLDVILAMLPDAVRENLEPRMQGYEYQSEFARKYYNQGRSEGLRLAVHALARSKLENVTAGDLAAIDALPDERALTELIGALGQASGPSEARAAFDLTVAGPRSV
jgi:hypothetical protein